MKKTENSELENIEVLRKFQDKNFTDIDNADEIIGLHGAGFANLVFTKSGSKVLELKPSTAGMVINNLAKQCNLEYDSISVVPEKHAANNQMGHINIDINLLKEKIK